jgi:outer membrane protein assembly factor BamB
MAEASAGNGSSGKLLRVWPGVAIVVVQWLLRFGLMSVVPEAVMIGVFGGLLGGVGVVGWWAFFSRAPLIERWGGIALMAVTLAATWFLIHESMRLLPFFAHIIPILSLAFVIWAVVSRQLPNRPRRLAMVGTVLLACGLWMLFRTGGVTGEFKSDFTWRWAETHEERLLAQEGVEDTPLPPTTPAMETGARWSGFRGPKRDGVVHGVRIETDWSTRPPVELWRRSVGPGWSSFAVGHGCLFTQEQRGESEAVSCYTLTTGEPVWKHRAATRFWESNAGAGPRGTPTLIDGRVFALGATGILNVLDARDGRVIWSRDVAADTETGVPTWGFSSSPLVVEDLVLAAAGGSLVAYDRTTGEPRWSNTAGGDCYSSPHLFHIDGIAQVLLLNEAGALSFAPADGEVLWEHAWPGYPIVQPAMTPDGDVLISVDDRGGIRRLAVTHDPDGWTAVERWTSEGIRPYFNDFVVHNDHAYGFEARSIACIDLKNGERKWKGGRYGRGQVLLLADQDLLLVLSEKGDLALVEAIPDQHTELARFPAIKGKTWNHPVLVGDVLLVRNDREMAGLRLALAVRGE